MSPPDHPDMIAVDSSALMAIVLGEAAADDCAEALQTDAKPLISAATVAEALIVAERRNVGDEMATLIDSVGFDIVPVTPSAGRRVADAYARWGKGIHPAGLNFGDCFAYDVASEHGCPLLYVGDDFSKTDVVGVKRGRSPRI